MLCGVRRKVAADFRDTIRSMFLLRMFLEVDAGVGEDDLVEHAELLVAVLARLVLDVLVPVVVHQAEPLHEGVESRLTAHHAPALPPVSFPLL